MPPVKRIPVRTKDAVIAWTPSALRGASRLTVDARKRSTVPSGQRRRSGGRRAFAGANVVCPALGVFLGRELFKLGLAAIDGMLVDLLQKRNAPTAPSARAAALRQHARNLWLRLPNEVHQLPPRDVKTVTYLGVGFHDFLILPRESDTAQSQSIGPGR